MTDDLDGVPGEEHPVRVVIADDESLVRTGLRLILGMDPVIQVVAEAEDGAQAVDQVRRHAPDVVLLDIRMPRQDGITALRRITADAPGVRVIVLTTFDTDEMVLRALRDGAAGFLLKDTPAPDLVQAVRDAAAGRSPLSPSVTHQLIAAVVRHAPDEAAGDARDRVATLTARELEVAVAVAAGLSNADIAQSLYMSVTTVKSHLGAIFVKLGASNRVQIAMLVRDAGVA